MIVCNYSVHNDTRIWDKPGVFKPERFITEDGKFQAPKEGFFAFGSGKIRDNVSIIGKIVLKTIIIL